MRRTMVTMVSMAALAACHHKNSSTTPDDGEEHTDPVGKGDGPKYQSGTQIPMDKLDEVNKLLARRNPTVSRCLAFVVDNKDLPRNSKGKMTISLTISPAGKVSDVKVTSDGLNSKPLEDCVIGKIKELEFPQLPKALDTSYTYGFEAI